MKLAKFTIFIFLVLVSVYLGQNLEKNQLSAYPNTLEAPTMSEQIPKSNYKPPKLSQSLFENDPSKKLRKSEFLDQIKYSLYQLTRAELEHIFTFADYNKDDLIDHKEWEAFNTLFIYPFEACDKNGNYLLDLEEYKTCFNSDPKTKLVTFRRRYEANKYALIMMVVSTRESVNINFSDYLFIKRSLFAWEQCHSNSKFLAVSHFKCAFRLAIPTNYHFKMPIEDIYKVGLTLANDKSLIELDFISYLRVLYFSYVFSIYGAPNDSPFLEHQQFIKAVREDRFPNNWDEEEIKILYDLINTNPFKKNISMNFSTFCFYFNLHRLFNTYSIEKPLQLNAKELENLLSDILFPKGITLSIDLAKTNFSLTQYLESSLVLQRQRVNEKSFYFGFKETIKQDASVNTMALHVKSTVLSQYQDIKLNAENRKIFFTTMAGSDKNYWTKEIYYRAFTVSNLFTSLCTDKRWIVSVPTFLENLHSQYDLINPPISQKLRNNYVIYKYLPRENNLDILAFIALESWNIKVNMHVKSSNDSINETLLKLILKDFGMQNMPDTVLDLTQKGHDQLKRRIYDYKETIKNVLIVQTTTAERVRDNEYQSVNKLSVNNEISRKYPVEPRRFMSSPLV